MPVDQAAVLPRSDLTSLKRLMMIGGAVAVFAVLVVSIYLHKALEEEAIQGWKQESIPLVRVLAGRIDQEVWRAKTALRLVAGLPEFQRLSSLADIDRSIGGVAESAESEKRYILDQLLSEYPDFSVLFMLTANGDHYLANPFLVQRSITKLNMRDRPYFQATLASQSTVLSNSYLGADGQLSVAINTPIKGPEGAMIGHLGGVFHLQHLAQFIRQFDFANFDELFLLDRNGSLVAHNDSRWIAPKQRDHFLQRADLRHLTSSWVDQGVGDVSYQELDHPVKGGGFHVFSVPLQFGWRLVALRDRDTLLNSIQSRSSVITVSTALILLCIAGCVLAFMNWAGRRWEQAELLLKAAKQRLEEEVTVRTHELTASHEHIELLLASTGAGIFGVDVGGYCTFRNAACLEILGYQQDQDLQGESLFDMIRHCRGDGTPYGREDSPILMSIHQDRRIHLDNEYFGTAGGDAIPVEFCAYPMRQQGKVVGAVITFNDISTRIHAQQAQADSDARFRSLFAQSNDAIFLLNPENGRYLDANRAAEVLTGRSVAELLSLTISDICPEGAEQRCTLARMIESIHDVGEVIYIRPDGSERMALLSVVPLTGGLVFSIAHDITDKLASERALKKSEAQLRAFSEAAFEAIFISEKGFCLGQNLAAQRLFGYTLDECIGRSALEWFAPESREQVRLNMLDNYPEPYEAMALRKDGTSFPVEIRGRSMQYQDRVVRVTALWDISDRYDAERKLQHSNALLHAVIDQAPFAITLGEGVAQDWRITLANQEAQRITGATAATQRGLRFINGELTEPDVRSWQILYPDGTPLDLQNTPLTKAMQEQRVTHNKELVILRADGVETQVLANASPIYDENGRHIAGIFIYPDISAHKRTEETVRTLSQAMEQSPISVLITDLEGVVEYANRGFERSSGYTSGEVIGQHTRLLGSGNTPLETYQTLWSTLASGKPWQGEFQNKRKDGTLFWEYAHLSPIFDGQGRLRHYLAMKEDITLRKVQEEKILHQAHYDSLTGLPNRFLALDRLSQVLHTAQRKHHLSAVLFLDLDDFKKVNDTLGHEVGDQVIEEAARRVSRSIRAEDTVGRLGGDEFIVLLSSLHEKQDAMRVAEKILAAFRTVFSLVEREILLTASIGISVYPDDGETSKILLRNADTAMYYSKSLGGNVSHFYTDAMNQDVSRRLELEGQLHTALDNGEFYLLYQPIVNIHTQSIVGAEALLRWNNPELGQVSPVEFIEIAERTGRIIEIGEYVLHQAVEQAKCWYERGLTPFRVAVNVSPVQFKDEQFVNKVKAILGAHQLPGDFLEIEVTEGVLLGEKINSVKMLNGLRDLGISISMDDFGTGYSSLSYLRNYPFDTLKIDRSFIRDITTDPEDRELVVATISMARSLGLKVIAEGVETAEQLTMLQAERCDFAQGYYFSKPMSETVLERLYLQ